MAVNLKGPKRRRLSMTSLIDVIFLLLLFFMLTSTFSKYSEVELMNAASGNGRENKQMLFVSLGEDSLMLNAQNVDMSLIAGLVEAQPNDGSGHLVLINLGEETSSQRLVDLLTSLRVVKDLQTMILS
ncbi:ExbD/TolR family protein [Parasedimentitalea maritima]|nr:biopolymer transporter ExbD [Zongyanglinia marina]